MLARQPQKVRFLSPLGTPKRGHHEVSQKSSFSAKWHHEVGVYEAAVKTTTYEFMGPKGALLITVVLPFVVLALYAFCNKAQCSIQFPKHFPCLSEFWHPSAYAIVMAWLLFQALLYIAPVGRIVKGTRLMDGSRLPYRINGLNAFVITHILFILGYFYFHIPVVFVYDKFLPLACAAYMVSLSIAVYLYAKSFEKNAVLSLGGNSGNLIYDWFIGRELNPRLWSFDWKFFCEMRPGLIGWVFINYCMMAKQYDIYGVVTPSMFLVCLFQAWYILDSLWFEDAVLTTMDIVHDGFGFMLVFGDLCWVPFTYSMQARFLVDYPTHLTMPEALVIFALHTTGYTIFRCSNSQKNLFRCNPRHPSVKNLNTLSTQRGTKLIVSGWWGWCRHPNYVGDLLMAFSWSLPCGFRHALPFFYVIYFAMLLIHRQLRDEHQCKAKYGQDWDKYCAKVKWRLIPGLY